MNTEGSNLTHPSEPGELAATYVEETVEDDEDLEEFEPPGSTTPYKPTYGPESEDEYSPPPNPRSRAPSDPTVIDNKAGHEKPSAPTVSFADGYSSSAAKNAGLLRTVSEVDMHVNMYQTVVPTHSFDQAPPGHLYAHLSQEAEPEIPLVSDWGEVNQTVQAENKYQQGVAKFYQILACMMYPLAVLAHEGVRFMGVMVQYFIVKPMTALVELVLKPLVDSLFFVSTPLMRIAEVLLYPVNLIWKTVLRDLAKCFAIPLASWRSGVLVVDEEMDIASEGSNEHASNPA